MTKLPFNTAKFWWLLVLSGMITVVFAAVGCGPSPANENPDPGTILDNPTQTKAAPWFTLPSAAGEDVSLESYTGESNVILVFYRGFW